MGKSLLVPKWEANKTINNIPIDLLKDKGIKVILLDVDNTLLPRRSTLLSSSILNWLIEAKKHFKLYLISNNPSKKRIKNVADQVDIGFTFSASKPRRSKVLKVINTFDCDIKDIAIIGDRIFTDIWSGNRLNLYTILVRAVKADGTEFKRNYYQRAEKFLSKLLGAIIK
tara:strand:- start:627 stop:1136 length:510 start_codon:yes stop_codon:yes gene_type:complete